MKRQYTQQEVAHALESESKRTSQVAMETRYGVKAARLSKIIKGREPISHTVAMKLGYLRRVVFEKLGPKGGE